MITIYQTRKWVEGVEAAGYATIYNASGKGAKVAAIAGPVDICDIGFGCDGGRLDDGNYALRDILAFAQRGERGLSIAITN